jgi:Kef-type K+ transport system membrane component KefB/nucleotide-binding universal stress UspA family protein
VIGIVSIGLSAGTLAITCAINLQHFADKLFQAPGILILQLILIMIVARIMGYLFQVIGQPLVIGEIVAGLILGPSVLGLISPEISGFLFPEKSVDILQQLSQLGLILFMFIIGMELDTQSFRKSANKALLISIASLLLPFVSGIILAYYLRNNYLPEKVQFTSFALFMGTTMCITAFPILARIVQERKLIKTPVGTMALTVAAIGDVVAWCILAVVIAIVKSGGLSHSFLTIGLSVVYILLMLYVVKPLMYRIGRVYASREVMGKPIVALVFLLILGSSLLTEAIGIHALFGAFMAGVVMPENMSFKRVFTEKIEDVSLVILLPLFFVSTGLRTEIGLINSGHLWLICSLIIVTAIAGKFGGTLLASRFVGLNWNHSLTLGVLMNAKGLMELIVLNIGYELGILSPEMFTMMVIMALATTLLTGPGLSLINMFRPKKVSRLLREKTYKIMLSFANPKMGGMLLNLTHQIIASRAADTVFTALHISPRSDLSPNDALVFEKESFAPIRRYAEQNKLTLSTVYRNTNDIHGEIIQTCRSENPDFLILGSARSVFSTDLLGGILKRIINEASCDVIVFNERNFSRIRSVLIVYFGNGDEYLFDYARLLNHNSDRKFYAHHRGLENKESAPAFNNSGIPMVPVTGSLLQPAFLRSIDLVLVSELNWKALEEKHNLPINHFPSLLIVHQGKSGNRILHSN